MTFVYAQKLDDCIFVLSDTYSEMGRISEPRHYFLQPLVKAIRVSDKYVLSFSGNAHNMEKVLTNLQEGEPDDNLTQLILDIHNESRTHDSDASETEFCIINIDDMQIYQIKDGTTKLVQTCWLGEKRAFERFQELRHSDQISHSSIKSLTSLSVAKVPDGLFESSFKNYFASLSAFQQVLIDRTGSVGGFAVPLIIKDGSANYMTYMQNLRGPIESSEVLPFPTAMKLNDEIRGGYQITFGGGERGFSAYFPYGMVGCIYRGFGSDLLQPKPYNGIDPYDFVYEVKQAGLETPVSTWRSSDNDFRKALQLIRSSQWNRAKDHLDELASELAKQISDRGNGVELNFSGNVIKEIAENGPITVSVADLINITSLFTFHILYLGSIGDEAALLRLRAQKSNWDDLMRKPSWLFDIEK